MTLKQAVVDTLNNYWDQAKAKIQERFPNLSDESIEALRTNTQQAVQTIADEVGETVQVVEDELTKIADEVQMLLSSEDATPAEPTTPDEEPPQPTQLPS